jgi:hypothetical protein
MGIINEQDRRPRDWAYRAAFDRKDLPSLQEMARHISQAHDTDMIEDFNAKCEQKLNENGETTTTRLNNGIEIQSVTKAEDLTVNGGLQQCINIILGVSSTRWQYMGLGTGGAIAPADILQTTLTTEVAGGRIDMAASGRGWREAVGMKLFFGAIGNEQAATNTLTELGVFTASSGGTMLNRNAFPNPGLPHTINRGAYIISSVIEFCPVL